MSIEKFNKTYWLERFRIGNNGAHMRRMEECIGKQGSTGIQGQPSTTKINK
jgi:hypothetical protein